MKANWTTKNGSKIEMTAEVIGKTAYDMICNKVTSMTLNGEAVHVIGFANEQGKHCVKVNINGKTGFITLPDDVYNQMNEQLKAVQQAAAATIKDDPARDAKDLADYLFAREMSNPNSDL